MNNLGECYALGLGVEQDMEKAMEWYRRRQSWEKPWPTITWAGTWNRPGHVAEAYVHYRKAAEGNDNSAWWGAGALLRKRHRVERDAKEARRCYETGEKLAA